MIALLQWLGVLGAFSVAFWLLVLNVALLAAFARRPEGKVQVKSSHVILIVLFGALGAAQVSWYGWLS